MTTRNQRIAEIEALFRAGNDRMAGWAERQEQIDRGEALRFFCECGLLRCRKQVQITAPEYEAVRADARRFVVAPGHERLEVEDVVERRDGYVVVQKHEDVRDLVERLSLRGRADP